MTQNMLTGLIRLRSLDLSSNKLTLIDGALETLITLEQLNLRGNALVVLGPDIFKVKNSKKIYIILWLYFFEKRMIDKYKQKIWWWWFDAWQKRKFIQHRKSSFEYPICSLSLSYSEKLLFFVILWEEKKLKIPWHKISHRFEGMKWWIDSTTTKTFGGYIHDEWNRKWSQKRKVLLSIQKIRNFFQGKI